MPNITTMIRTNHRERRSICPDALCGFPQWGQTESPIGISVSQNSQIIGASMMNGAGPDAVTRDTHRQGNANVGRFVPVATIRCAWLKPAALKRKTPRLRTGLFWPTALGFQRLAASRIPNLKLKIQKATAPR
ncbi:hypothetical protein [Bradyrhizobium liaoningense]|uniref:hypothetical protein n=1 Tax=Bradyrhizobium liaoningense TaxID=43992 RepID=UPI001BAC6736|nr:hypothetical protein [Bradyrhizobium liaoningense]MBR0983000.1 hypothetical protein [Bradyrhizobium liaoningense]